MRVSVTDHAVEAYTRRVRPIPAPAARREILALVKLAGKPVEGLDWKHDSSQHGATYLELTDGVALVLKGSTAVTVVVRGAQGTHYADERRRAKRERRARKRREREAKLRASGRYKVARLRREATDGPGWPE